jgi:hypothetical protein
MPGSLEVQEQLDLGRLLHWQVGRLLAFENTSGVNSDETLRVTDAAHFPILKWPGVFVSRGRC